MKVTISGLDEANKKIGAIVERAKSLEQPTSVAIEDLLTPEFMSAHTKFSSLAELKKASGFQMETVDEFEDLPEEKLDAFMRRETQFSNWTDMIKAAGAEWVKRQLGL